jgi:multicomponent Na+:H+ antiporter subunit D
MVSGNTSYSAIAQTLHSDSARGSFARIAVGLFLCGLFIKGGLMPFHGWVADAYSAAPAPVSVFLAGIVTKVSGLYPLIRLVTAVFGFSAPVAQILLLVGAISVVGGALAALGQRDFKRMLAYSSISQVGYIVLGLGCGTPLGVAGAVFHLFNHAIFKSQLFVNAAAVEQRLGTRDMGKMGGLGAKMPFTSTTSVLAFLSTAGVPPLAGFWSKLVIILALWKSAHQTYAVVAVLASVLTLAYFLLMQRWVFFGKLGKGLENVKEARAGLVVPAVVLAALTVGVGLAFSFVLETFILPAAGMR